LGVVILAIFSNKKMLKSFHATSSAFMKKVQQHGRLSIGVLPQTIVRRNFHSVSTTLNQQEVPIHVQITESNIPPSVHSKIGRFLHKKEHHPLCIIKTVIQNHFASQSNQSDGRYLVNMLIII